MPELPEVETTRQGIEPYIKGQKIRAVRIYERRLRWLIDAKLPTILTGEVITDVSRRGKYLLLTTAKGTLIIHLGMSGSLRMVDHHEERKKHDHVELQFETLSLRLNDPRRFGAVLWAKEPLEDPRLAKLGPEPLARSFQAKTLFERSRGIKRNIKSFIMDSAIVVGVGNIYATEALFQAGIHPEQAAGNISHARYLVLVKAIKQILRRAIKAGGTTLKDFLDPDGKPGYFRFNLKVYGRGGEACVSCGEELKSMVLNQRATVYCPRCQK